MKFRVASLQADNAAPFYRATAHYVAEKLGWESEYIGDVSWGQRDKMLDDGPDPTDFGPMGESGWKWTVSFGPKSVTFTVPANEQDLGDLQSLVGEHSYAEFRDHKGVESIPLR